MISFIKLMLSWLLVLLKIEQFCVKSQMNTFANWSLLKAFKSTFFSWWLVIIKALATAIQNLPLDLFKRRIFNEGPGRWMRRNKKGWKTISWTIINVFLWRPFSFFLLMLKKLKPRILCSSTSVIAFHVSFLVCKCVTLNITNKQEKILCFHFFFGSRTFETRKSMKLKNKKSFLNSPLVSVHRCVRFLV